MASWEEMAEQVLILGRPGDVRSAALDWDQLLKACDEVKTSLDKNVTDLNQGWKGPAYEAFKTHIKAISKQLSELIAGARVDDGIVTALTNAADKLEKAQQDMPIPAICTGDLYAARNLEIDIPVGYFTMKLKSSFLSSVGNSWFARAEYQLMDWINDKETDARRVYDRVDGEFRDQTYRTPGSAKDQNSYEHKKPHDNLNNPGGLGNLPGSGKLPGAGMPKTGLFSPPHSGTGDARLPGTGSMSGVGSGGGYDPSTFDPSTAGGLAGAGGGFSGAGLGGGGLGGGGLGGGLGGAGGLTGAGGGGLPGGGALGKGVMPSMGGLTGAGGAGGGARSGARSGRGAIGGGHGGEHGGAEDERTTWLQEDDDPWGADGGTPGVLK